ncbi:putative metal-dependent hydrolase [Leptospira inadai serovar Lyme str. 10]|uniref:Metal-dependent hydrolase n=2 Tax=Leptospira inadai serovar Lyme TaxID=293084 RepID=A0ABX4YFM5_9LEPT|nr:metal-dependent hydrolase [Leptospira inadai]EQA38224.1 putative metal-dependent hydrolase [Leptospira inadai serovar Lyme str. 10]PNV74009.1 metal-dependent hydrolase [Leptospira inadai serovar Lyme]
MKKKSTLQTKNFNFYPVRKPKFEFSNGGTSKHWLEGSAYKTHIMNTWTLFFPDGEKFFIRSIQTFMTKIKDPRVLRNATAFIGQEAQHAGEHKKTWKILEDQGYRISGFIGFFNALCFKFLERFGSRMTCLSATAGAEHYTSLIATIGLKMKVLDGAESEMRRLWEWHAAEEIEHKSAAFDVLLDVSGNYFRRVLGFLAATLVFWPMTFVGAEILLRQDGLTFRWKTRKDAFRFLFTEEKVFFHWLAAFFRYLKPNFHPDQEDNLELSKAILQSPEHRYKEIA